MATSLEHLRGGEKAVIHLLPMRKRFPMAPCLPRQLLQKVTVKLSFSRFPHTIHGSRASCAVFNSITREWQRDSETLAVHRFGVI